MRNQLTRATRGLIAVVIAGSFVTGIVPTALARDASSGDRRDRGAVRRDIKAPKQTVEKIRRLILSAFEEITIPKP